MSSPELLFYIATSNLILSIFQAIQSPIILATSKLFFILDSNKLFFLFIFLEFLRFAQIQEHNRIQWLTSIKEARRLQRELDESLQIVAGLETKLYHARRLLESETKCRKEVEKERDAVVSYN